jgi:hypothetical protein
LFRFGGISRNTRNFLLVSRPRHVVPKWLAGVYIQGGGKVKAQGFFSHGSCLVKFTGSVSLMAGWHGWMAGEWRW